MAEFKFFCPQCGQRIQCDTGYVGTQINCPICQQPIVVPQVPGAGAPPPNPAAPAAGRQFSGAPVAPPPAAKTRVWQNLLVAAGVVLVLAGLGVGGWYGYLKFKRGHLPAGLVALWSAEGDARDATGSHNGTITTQFAGDVSFSPGAIGKAFDFHGLNFVEIQPIALTNCTIEFWCCQRTRSKKFSDTHFGSVLISDEVCGVVDDWHIGLLANGHLVMMMGNATRGVDSAFPSASVIPLNKFVHVAVTRSVVTGHIQIYLNGVLDSTFTAPHNRVMGIAAPGCDNYPNTIGIGFLRRYAARGNVDSVVDAFDGLIDEVGIYNRALSADEIRQRFDAGK